MNCNLCGVKVSGFIDVLNGKAVCEKCFDENYTFEIPTTCWTCGKNIENGKRYCSSECEEKANAQLRKLNNLINKADEIINEMKDK